MKTSSEFQRCMLFVRPAEGDYSNDPTDRGKETKYGISKKAYPHLDIKNLTREHAEELYFLDYWYPLACDLLDYPDNLCVFDSGIQHGVRRTVLWARNLKEWSDLIPIRRRFYAKIIAKDPLQIKYKNGWENRLINLEREYERFSTS